MAGRGYTVQQDLGLHASIKCSLRSVPAGCHFISMFVICAYKMAQAVFVPLKLINGRKLMGSGTSSGKGRVPRGAVLGFDLMACLCITAQLAVVFALSKDWMVACNTILAKISLL